MTATPRPTDRGEKPADPNGADPLDQESLPPSQPDGTGQHEPSVLDYVKARLTPWRGPAPQIPAEGHGLAYERLGRAQIQQRFPGFNVPADWDVVFEAGGGILQTQACQDACLK